MDLDIAEAQGLIDEAAAALFASDFSVRSVGIGQVGDRAGFIAIRNTRAVAPFSLTFKQPREPLADWRGVPVAYQATLTDPVSLAQVPHSGPASPGVGSHIDEQSGQRPLYCGLQIQNIDDDLRSGVTANGLMTVGTLGCFVTLKSGAVALLTNNHVAARENRGLRGADRILQSGGSAYVLDEHIATLSDFAPLTPSPPGAEPRLGNAVFNDIDAAIAELLPGQVWRQQYLPLRHASPPTGNRAPMVNDKVRKVGRTTGLTYGEVKQVNVQVKIPCGIGECWFRGSFIIEGAAGTTFSNHGDSGSAIVGDSDGMLMGLLYAGSSTQTYACPIAPVLTALQCTVA